MKEKDIKVDLGPVQETLLIPLLKGMLKYLCRKAHNRRYGSRHIRGLKIPQRVTRKDKGG